MFLQNNSQFNGEPSMSFVTHVVKKTVKRFFRNLIFITFKCNRIFWCSREPFCWQPEKGFCVSVIHPPTSFPIVVVVQWQKRIHPLNYLCISFDYPWENIENRWGNQRVTLAWLEMLKWIPNARNSFSWCSEGFDSCWWCKTWKPSVEFTAHGKLNVWRLPHVSVVYSFHARYS